jgi:hypothetical protein
VILKRHGLFAQVARTHGGGRRLLKMARGFVAALPRGQQRSLTFPPG